MRPRVLFTISGLPIIGILAWLIVVNVQWMLREPHNGFAVAALCGPTCWACANHWHLHLVAPELVT
jgi:hypothetical protein